MDDKLNTSKQSTVCSRQFLLLIVAPCAMARFALIYCLLSTVYCHTQYYHRTDTIPVKVNGNWLKNPWTGGHNYVQLSNIDMNFDGIKDLFVFDRTGHKITAYINKGTANTVDYIDSTFKYASKFPHLEDWVLLADFNCDGKEDIFTYANPVAGIKVWRNTSSGGNLQFTLQTPYIKSKYYPSNPPNNLYVSRVDIPSMVDMDNDGDLDVLTFDFSSTNVEFHINQSQELGYNCDSLIFILDPNGCWGNFQENSNNCSVNLSACRKSPYPPEGGNTGDALPNFPPSRGLRETAPSDELDGSSLHVGSCLLCLDMDADGDKEIIIGDISCCNITMLTNGGTPLSATMISKDTAFPSANIPVNLTLFPCGYFVDVNNDNKRDLIVCPNAPNASVNNESIWYYKNIGTDNAPVFNRMKKNFLQDEMIEVGEGANPVFFDFDNDGLTDLLISNYTLLTDTCHPPPYNNSYTIYAFKNIGAASSPKFELVNTDFASISVQLAGIPGKHLTFGDLDGDGDQDMMIGDYDGFIHYFQNTGGTGPAIFTLPPVLNYPDDTGMPIDIGSYATPQLIDADRDGDLDLIIGERAGNLNYYENTGSSAAPVFSFVTNSLGGVDTYPLSCCTGYSVPFMYDSAGDYRLMVGSEASRSYPATGWLWVYKNIDGNLGGNFTPVDSMYQNIWEGLRMTVNGKDISADGSMDLVIGNYAGGVALYMGDSNAVSVPELNSSSFDFSIYPNPSSGMFNVQLPALNLFQGLMANLPAQAGGNTSAIEVCNMFGEKVFTSTINHPPLTIHLNLPAGVYFCKVSGENFSKAKKLVILK